MDTLTYVTVRPPRPVEDRCIVRHSHKFYNNIVVAGIYKLPTKVNASQVRLRSTYVPALRGCLEKHAFLSVVHGVNEKGGREFSRVSHVDLSNHIHVIDEKIVQVISKGNDLEEDDILARVLEHVHNDPGLTFYDTASTSPSWRMDVLPLQSTDQQQRVWLSFTYSHHIGDGMSGMILHNTFLDELIHELLQPLQDVNSIFETQEAELPRVPNLPITPGYLLGPALGHYLPSFLTNLLGLKASTTGSDAQTWTGTPTFLSSQSSCPPITTAIEILSISSSTLASVLQSCRLHDTKLTSLLNSLIAQSMSHLLPLYSSSFHNKTNLIATSATNIRKACNIPADTVGNFASATFAKYPILKENNYSSLDPSSIPTSTISNRTWTQSSIHSHHISTSASSTQNQPIGLLSWISDIPAWMKEQMNKDRDSSWLVSNLLSFNGRSTLSARTGGEEEEEEEEEEEGIDVQVEKMYFSACADGVGSPLDFNIVSTVGGELVVCLGWQVGCLGLDLEDGIEIEVENEIGRGRSGDEGGQEKRERTFVTRVLETLRALVEGVAAEDKKLEGN